MNLPTRADFSRNVNTTFRIRRMGSEDLLTELTEVKESYAGPGTEAFSLLFRGPRTSVLPQSTYTFDHEQLGELSIFLVPVGADASGIYYEAVFNRTLATKEA